MKSFIDTTKLDELIADQDRAEADCIKDKNFDGATYAGAKRYAFKKIKSICTDATPISDALKEAIAFHKKKHDAEVRAADIHNNSDGVGIDFDYMSVPSMPPHVEKLNAALILLEQL